MVNYKGTITQGEAWQRCYAISIMNSLDGTRLVQFHEQSVVDIGGKQFVQEVGTCHTMYDANGVIPLLDLNTGEPTGQTISHAAMYQILYSAYMQAALARDEAAEAPQS